MDAKTTSTTTTSTDSKPAAVVARQQPVAKPHVRKSHRLTAEQLVARYPWVDASTLQYDQTGKHANKQTVVAHLSCGHDERIATSDLFQTSQCSACKHPRKSAQTPAAKPVVATKSTETKPAAASTHMPSADARKAALANG